MGSLVEIDLNFIFFSLLFDTFFLFTADVWSPFYPSFCKERGLSPSLRQVLDIIFKNRICLHELGMKILRMDFCFEHVRELFIQMISEKECLKNLDEVITNFIAKLSKKIAWGNWGGMAMDLT